MSSFYWLLSPFINVISVERVGTAFLTSLKIEIYKDLSWGMTQNFKRRNDDKMGDNQI